MPSPAEFSEAIERALSGHFGDVPAAEVAALAARLRVERVAVGDVVYRLGERGDCMHFVLTGRLRVMLRDGPVGERIVAHRSSGEFVGELSLLTGEPRTADVVAVRESLLARLDRSDFEAFIAAHSAAGLRFAREALRALRVGRPEASQRASTIALVPLQAHVPIEAFGRRLELALLRFGTTRYLDPSSARARGAVDDLAIDRLFDSAERERQFVIGECAADLDAWTRKCVMHADRVLFVGHAEGSPDPTPIERSLAAAANGVSFAERWLILLHRSRAMPPAGTAAWLGARDVHRHSHVAWESGSDFSRLARLISGNAVTLVLGGGGARGLAQVGAVRAIREAGIPIDAVGGTSIGAIVGALVAFGWSDAQILQSCRHAFVDDRPLDDLTLPMFALLSGRKLERTLRHYVGDVDIVDLWQPYFCVSTNLSKSRVDVHTSGSLWKAIQASASLPGLLPPVVAGGDLHVDGGVLDNLPVGIMKRFIRGSTIAVECAVSVEYAVGAERYPSPLQYLRTRLSGRSDSSGFPTLPNLLIKSTVLGGRGGRAELQDGVDLYLNPPLGKFGFLDWDAIYDIVDTGYRHAQRCLRPWIEEGPPLQRRDPLRMAGVL